MKQADAGKVGTMLMTNTLWQCEQLRAGQVYSRELFVSKNEAEEFMRKLQLAQPDMMLRLAAVQAKAIWN